jgi:catechol 2,3-dioxygenase-like lactoylglutathione lyase family enzyme
MSVELNHTIIWCRDKRASASYLTSMLGLPDAREYGPFKHVQLTNGVSVDFHNTDDEIVSQHYAFLISEADFDAVLGRLDAASQEHWADPMCSRLGINTNDGGRGTYFSDPDGHFLEVITRPYGADSGFG